MSLNPPKRPYKMKCFQCGEDFVVPRHGRMVYRCQICQPKFRRAMYKAKKAQNHLL